MCSGQLSRHMLVTHKLGQKHTNSYISNSSSLGSLDTRALGLATKSFSVMRLVVRCRSADAVRLADRYARPSATCRDLQCWPPWVHAQAAFFAGDLPKVSSELEYMSLCTS